MKGIILSVLVISMLLLAACSASMPTTSITTTATITPVQTTTNPTTPSALTSTTSPTITTTPTRQITWGEFSDNNNFGMCGFRCHGDAGQGGVGPAIIGQNASLDFYGNALRLFEYISTQMPQDEPGSLSSESYLKILAFLLIENGFVQPEQLYSIDELINMDLKE